MPNPDPAEPTRRQRLAQVADFLSTNSEGRHSDSDTRKAGACLGCSDTQFGSVFFDERDAQGKLGRDNYIQFQIGGKTYFVSSWAVYDPELQERVLIEVTYRLLFEPAVYNDIYVHRGSTVLGNVLLGVNGEFAKQGDRGRPRITEMPTLHEIADALREIGYFKEDRSNADLIKLVREVLPSSS